MENIAYGQKDGQKDRRKDGQSYTSIYPSSSKRRYNEIICRRVVQIVQFFFDRKKKCGKKKKILVTTFSPLSTIYSTPSPPPPTHTHTQDVKSRQCVKKVWTQWHLCLSLCFRFPFHFRFELPFHNGTFVGVTDHVFGVIKKRRGHKRWQQLPLRGRGRSQ